MRDGVRLFAFFGGVGVDSAADVVDPTTRRWWAHTTQAQAPGDDRQRGKWWKQAL